jgi:hypothetical protein
MFIFSNLFKISRLANLSKFEIISDSKLFIFFRKKNHIQKKKNHLKYLDFKKQKRKGKRKKKKKSIYVWAWPNRAPTGHFGVRRSAHAPLWVV